MHNPFCEAARFSESEQSDLHELLYVGDMTMDFYGIGAAVKGATSIYFRSARQTGRTTTMLSTLNDGDRVYFATSQEAKRFEAIAKQRGKDIECVTIPVSDPEKVFDRGTCQGRAIFDHSWVEQYYLSGIDRMQKDIKHFEEQSSGWGEAHEQTKLKAQELKKWQHI